MDKACQHRGAVWATMTSGIATTESQLLDPATPVFALHGPQNLVNMSYEEMKALYHKMQEGLSGEDFYTDLVASWEYDAKVVDIRSHVEFVTRPVGTPHAFAGDSGAGDRSNEASGATLR